MVEFEVVGRWMGLLLGVFWGVLREATCIIRRCHSGFSLCVASTRVDGEWLTTNNQLTKTRPLFFPQRRCSFMPLAI